MFNGESIKVFEKVVLQILEGGVDSPRHSFRTAVHASLSKYLDYV